MSRFVDWIEKPSPGWAMAISLALVLIIGLVDYATGYALVFSAFYLLPVSLAAWHKGLGGGIVLSVLSVAAWLAGDYAAGVHYTSTFVPAWNGLIALAVYGVVVTMLVSLRTLQRELEERVRQRTVALALEMEERTRLEREMLDITERAQRKIGHDLHDVLGQRLTAAALASQVLHEKLKEKSLPESAAAHHLVEMMEASIALTRNLARGLQPLGLEAEGFMDGLQELARNISERFGVNCEFECPTPLFPGNADCCTHLYRIAQEAVSNAIRHGRARFINISLEKQDRSILFSITDDGAGMPEQPSSAGGLGLRIMAYRAGMIGAQFKVERLTESGTRVSCRLNQP